MFSGLLRCLQTTLWKVHFGILILCSNHSSTPPVMHMTHFSWQVRDIHAFLIPFATVLDKKCFKNFALCYPQYAYHTGLVLLCCSFKVRNYPPRLQHFCLGWEGGIFVVTSAFKSFILKLGMATSINSDFILRCFSGPILIKFEHKLRHHKQRCGKTTTTAVMSL